MTAVMANLYGNRWKEDTVSRWATASQSIAFLPGAAVTAVKIDGVLHEFSTIPGVREDVADIILNIKALCLKVSSEEPKLYVSNAAVSKKLLQQTSLLMPT